MEKWQIERFLAHSKTSGYLKRLDESRAIIRDSLRFMKNPYVAFSCGKDSSVLACLVLEIRPETPLRFLSSGETRIVHNVDDVINWFKEHYNANIQEILIDRVFTEEWAHATWTEQRKAGKHDLEQLNAGDWDGVYMGLRAQESARRRRSLYLHQTPGLPPFCYQYQAGRRKKMIRCCPLAKWQVDDIGAFIVTHQIPILKRYHRYGLEARTTARLTGDAVRQYILSDIKRDNPQGWNKLVRRFPEFKAFV